MSSRILPAAICATLLLAGCGGGNSSRPAAPDQSRASHGAAAAAMDASFDKEFAPARPAPTQAAAKPAEKPAEKSAAKPAEKPAEARPAQGRPAWVDQLPRADGKLYAVGGAMKGRRDEARRKALQELASSLRVQVQATTTIDESEITRIGPGGERVGRAMSAFRNEARLTVDRELTFATIAAEAEDVKDSWALAELDRVAWAAKLRQEIAGVDTRLVAERDRIAAAGGGMQPAARALRAVGPLAARRDVLVSDLILADPGAQPPAMPIDLMALYQTCARGLASVSLKLEGAPDDVFAARAHEAMAKQGLLVNERTGTVVVRLALRETPRTLPNGWASVNVAGSATVVDAASGNIAGSLQIDVRGVDPDPAQARAKMLDNASSALARELNQRLIDLLAGGQ